MSRLGRLQKLNREPQRRAVELAYCARDVVHWVNSWGWTYDPREPSSFLPFDLWARQAEYLRWLAEREERQEGGLVEKSRDVGITWLCCAYALHGFLFREGFQCGFGSRKLDLVDRKGDPACIFEKLRFLLRHLPAWMRPTYADGHARLANADNGATITGEGGDNIGRGGRSSLFFVDEAAYVERPQMIESSLSQTTRCRIDVSTPNGPGNPFAMKRFSGAVPVFTFSWRSDPRKDDAWYAKQKATLDPVTVAQEIDLDYTASIEGITIPAAWVRAAVNFDLPASGPVIAGLDVSEEGPDVTVLQPRQGPVARMPVAWGKLNTTEGAWKARDEARRLGVAFVNYDAGGPGVGFRGTWETATQALGFEARGIAFGGTPSLTYWPDGQNSQQKFVNLRAEMWWRLRTRFERVYEYREQGIRHALEDMISIPNCPQLIAELSQPLTHRTDVGKIQLESKKVMRARGIKSPDHADALALAFADTPLASWPLTSDPSSRSHLADLAADVFGGDERGRGGSVADFLDSGGW